MSSHIIGFSEEMTKITFQLSSDTHLISFGYYTSYTANKTDTDQQAQLIHLIENIDLQNYHLSGVMRKLVFGVSERFNTNRDVQPQKMARGLKFRI